MAEPNTTNVALIVPNTGDLPGTWGSGALNPNFNALDGFFGGVQTISLSNANLTLSAPGGSITPSGGPTQSQNAILTFTGALSANVQVTLPLPGYYIVENLTTGNFVVTFAAASAGQIIAVDQGESQHIFNNGTNVKFANFGRIGHIEMWAGFSAMPAWVNACTAKPYLLCDGSIHNVSDFPFLFSKIGGNFGGNGVTTFGVPDHRGRMALPYDGTGTRITTAGSGLNGQSLGASLDQQNITLSIAQMPNHAHANTLSDPGHFHDEQANSSPGTVGNQIVAANGSGAIADTGVRTVAATANISLTNASIGGGGAHPNIQPSQVTGISVIRAA